MSHEVDGSRLQHVLDVHLVQPGDKDGKLIREVDGTKEVGMNRVNWDLRARSVLEPPREEREAGEGEQPAAAPAGGGGFGGFGGALRVEPGEYTVKVIVGKIGQSKKVVVEEDPRIELSQDDLAALNKMMNEANVPHIVIPRGGAT